MLSGGVRVRRVWLAGLWVRLALLARHVVGYDCAWRWARAGALWLVRFDLDGRRIRRRIKEARRWRSAR